MLTIRKSQERGATRIDWLDSRHTFSFADYHDPTFMGFGALRVINEDRVAGGKGFPPHSHRDMEIITYLLEGALEHRDSTGAGGIIRPGEIQRMSAGTGITHSESNASRDKPVHFLQIWIAPSAPGLKPSYEQKAFDDASVRNRLSRIASPEPRECEVRIDQDAEIWVARLEPDIEVVHPIEQGRRAWLQVAKGEVRLNEATLLQGDAAAITDEDRILVRSKRPSEVLLFDLA